MIGTLYDRTTLFLRTFVGEAEDDSGNKYELATSVSSGAPLIQNKNTGKTFTVKWDELVELAKKAGIDDE